MGLRSTVKTLWKRKWTVILVPVVTMESVGVVRLFGGWEYTSTAQMSTGITLKRELANREDRLEAGDLEIEFNILIEVIKSPAVINQVSYKLLQHDVPTSSISFRKPSERSITENVGINLLAYEDDFHEILDKKVKSRTALDAVSEGE